jgi:S1-C subfamily serine protease
MDQLISKGKVQRGQLGVEVQNVTSDIASSMGLKQVQGVLVSAVTHGSPAEKAGLKPGDVILQMNGTAVNDTNTLRNQVATTAPGTDVTLTILRAGRQQQMHAKLGEFTPPNNRSGQQPGGGSGEQTGRLGIAIQPLTPDIAQQVNVPKNTQGVVITQVDPNGPAAEAGIRAGDVITQVNRQPVKNPGDVRAALGKSGNRPPLLLIDRGGQSIFVPVPLH